MCYRIFSNFSDLSKYMTRLSSPELLLKMAPNTGLVSIL